MNPPSHATARAQRAALDQRIKTAAEQSGITHDRLRKAVGFHRLVARFAATGSHRWAIKGGAVLLWRLGYDVRATRDVDANWLGSPDDLDGFLRAITAEDVSDWFRFEIGSSTPLQGETLGALRFPVTALLDGREFAAFRLDINFVEDLGPTELIDVVDPLGGSGVFEPVAVTVVSVASQLAEKLHAVNRVYRSGESSRAKDAYDTFMLARSGQISCLESMRASVERTFSIRDTAIPRQPPPLPKAWDDEIEGLLAEQVAVDASLPAIREAWQVFWQPVLDRSAGSDLRWDAETMRWLER
ncbi:MAG: nucleotidyl transferase AbiEii/AbiGii toxin family protein [Acidimicrobiia bacterium]|nr:MAG: nucleotidyl transferase AbiEii/AbiGii toxin family protein [Acidimicrobiia bacterium]